MAGLAAASWMADTAAPPEAALAFAIFGSIVWSMHRLFPANIWTEGPGACDNMWPKALTCGPGTALMVFGVCSPILRAWSGNKPAQVAGDGSLNSDTWALQRHTVALLGSGAVAVLTMVADGRSSDPLLKERAPDGSTRKHQQQRT
eukprot:CAMPEP_0171099912 /NCGR_PEP_ID=MMETSP0766_2-20121228/52648_1 /TAXON_ID=439317 /ORGANISM="Gambierdiscus australes, Strain CAWD 149" /LENGTH=145 /DNA_ID=CAMNT_0011559645 /DNA_START=83 /DNA_END=517 /DNA_ORIENTATION=+